MKTTKKGFTLIELIVVIAIIGVLAAILVPAMLGYVKKSKIQSANAAASTILKACNSALTEMDEVDKGIDSGVFTSGGFTSTNLTLMDYMDSYSDDVRTAKYKIYIVNNVGIVCAVKSGSYYGTAPAAYTNKTYPKSVTGDIAIAAALTAYNSKHADSVAAPTSSIAGGAAAASQAD